jgi:hypothetical protein
MAVQTQLLFLGDKGQKSQMPGTFYFLCDGTLMFTANSGPGMSHDFTSLTHIVAQNFQIPHTRDSVGVAKWTVFRNSFFNYSFHKNSFWAVRQLAD